MKISNLLEYNKIIKKLGEERKESNSIIDASNTDTNKEVIPNDSINKLKTKSFMSDRTDSNMAKSVPVDSKKHKTCSQYSKGVFGGKIAEPKNQFLRNKQTKQVTDNVYDIDTKSVNIDKEAVLCELDRTKEFLCNNKQMVQINGNSVLYLLIKPGIQNHIQMIMSTFINFDTALHNAERIKLLSYLILFTVLFYLMLHHIVVLVLFAALLMLLLRFGYANNIKFYFVQYVQIKGQGSQSNVNIDFDKCYTYLKRRININIKKIFPGFLSPDHLVELQRIRAEDNMHPTLELYLCDFKKGKIESYLKIQLSNGLLLFKYFGKASQEVYMHLTLMALKITMKSELRTPKESLQADDKKDHEDRLKQFNSLNKNSKIVHSNKSEVNDTKQNRRDQLKELKPQVSKDDILKSKKLQTADNNTDYRLNDHNELFLCVSNNLIEAKEQYNTKLYIDMLYNNITSKFYNMVSNSTSWRLEKQTDIYVTKSWPDDVFVIRRTDLQIKSTIDKVIEVLSDLNNITKYNLLISSSSKVRDITADAALSHIIVKCPFPLTNRDITHINIYRRVSDKKAIVAITSAPEAIMPASKKFVRSLLTRLYGFHCLRD